MGLEYFKKINFGVQFSGSHTLARTRTYTSG